MRILVLDDQLNLYIRLAELDTAIDENLAVVLTETPEQAEQALANQQFDILLLDGILDRHQKIFGPDVLTKWKEGGKLAIPAVILMVSSDPNMQYLGMVAGAKGTIDKFDIIGKGVEAVKQKLAGLSVSA